MHPVLFHLGHVVVPSFGAAAMVGLFIALRLSERTAAMLRLNADALWDASLFAVIAAFVASRLLLVLSNPRGFAAAPLLLLRVPSLTVGGLGLTLLLVVAYLRWKRLPILRSLDAWAAPGLVLWAALALGHLLEGSDPGMPTTAVWGMRLNGYRQQPVALYAALLAVGLAGVILDRTQRVPRPGHLAAAALIGAGVAQFVLTFLRAPYLWASTGWWVALDPIEWAALAMVLAGGVLWTLAELRPTSAAVPNLSPGLAREG